MKKKTTVFLITFMTLGLLCGCAGSERKVSTAKSQIKESTIEESAAESSVEASAEESSATESAEESTVETIAEEDSTPLYEKICGRYCYEYPGDDEMNTTYPLEIFHFGGNLYAFGGDSMDSFDSDHIASYSFWAMEFLPEKSEDLFAADADECDFGMLTFSIMSNVGKYWNKPDEIMVKIVEDGLEISGMPYVEESPALFRRNDHIERAFCYKNRSPVDEKMDQNLLGIWQQVDAEIPFYVAFSENNNIEIYRKAPLSEVYYLGGSFRETDTCHLECTLSTLGSGGMPTDLTIDYSLDAGTATMRFSELYDTLADPYMLLDELTFQKVDADAIPVITLDDVKDLEIINIYEEMNLE